MTNADLKIFPEVVERRRNQYGGLAYLSDWQVHSAHLSAGAISSIASGWETGPTYVPMPTGSGKTTGAIWGIVDFVKNYPDQSICFMTPYKSSVDSVYSELVGILGKDKVGYYHGDAIVAKNDELRKQVVVLTHQFIEYNHGRLDDRDVFVIDEAIYATGEATLKLEHFVQARSWATRHGVYPDQFDQLMRLAYNLDTQLRKSDKKYVAVPFIDDLSWARQIANELSLADHAQSIDNMELLVSTQRFCEALLEGLVFLSRGNIDADKHDPIYSAAVLGIPRIDKTVILSATGGMVYDIAGPFHQDGGCKHYWRPPSYQNLTLNFLTGPEIKGQYKTWSSQFKNDEVIAYVDWVLQTVEESSIYLTLPKQVIDSCLRTYFDQPTKGALEYPIKTTKHGKNLYVAHHALSVGTNQFKDCDAVVYLWENHLPQSVAVQRYHTLANDQITDDALEDANSGHLVGDYQRIREAQYIDNMMQQIGRGTIRAINDEAQAGKMTAYVHCHPSRFERLASQYRNCVTTSTRYDNDSDQSQKLGRIDQVLNFIRLNGNGNDIPASEVEKAVGFKLSRYRPRLSGNWDIMMLGYEFVAGERGRGKSSYFKFINDK